MGFEVDVDEIPHGAAVCCCDCHARVSAADYGTNIPEPSKVLHEIMSDVGDSHWCENRKARLRMVQWGDQPGDLDITKLDPLALLSGLEAALVGKMRPFAESLELVGEITRVMVQLGMKQRDKGVDGGDVQGRVSDNQKSIEPQRPGYVDLDSSCGE